MITLQKWGNSQGIRLPKFLLDELGWNENDELSISKDDDKIIIKKHNKRKSIVELFDGYKEKKRQYPLRDKRPCRKAYGDK